MVHPAKRRRGARHDPDPDAELDPRDGLWRFAWAWFHRAPAPLVEAPTVEEPAPIAADTPAVEALPAKVKRTPKRPRARAEVAHTLGFRQRAHAWLTRPSAPLPLPLPLPSAESPPVEPPPVEPPPAEKAPLPKRRRAPKKRSAAPTIDWRRRAWSWLVERPARLPAPVEATDDGELSVPRTDVARAHLKGVLEALVFASEHPMPAKELARVATAELRIVKVLLAELVAEYRGRGFRLDEVAGGFVFRTSPAFAPFVREQVAKKPVRMSRAQLETLAIVAYRQPVTRPEVDDVRGVDSGAVLKSLLERDLVRILGKKDEPGRPMLYGTTGDFLEFFGLKALADLPTLREFSDLTDESRRTYEREMGEEPVDYSYAGAAPDAGFMGGEGALREVGAETEVAESGTVEPEAVTEGAPVEAVAEGTEDAEETATATEDATEDATATEDEDEDEDDEDEDDEDEDDEDEE